MQRLTMTLAILKPDVYAHPIYHQRILKLIHEEGFVVAKEAVTSWNKRQVGLTTFEQIGSYV